MSATRAQAAALLLGVGCSIQGNFPGDTVLATFDFRATLESDDCSHPDGGVFVDGGGLLSSFEGTLSLDSKTSAAWLTVGSTVLPGTLVGDHLALSAQAQRGVPYPTCAGTLREAIEARLIDLPGLDAGFDCAAADGGGLRDGGAGGGPDAGLGVGLVCGTLTDEFEGPPDVGDGCELAPCRVVYTLSGRLK